MPFPPDLTSALPAPRDDEPPELRSRIVKELRDHLECAYRRELLLTGNEEEAARRAVANFGDPARLARKLWFDALKEQIMSQRILVGLCSVMTAACLAMGALAWRLVSEATGATRELVAQSREANQGLMAMLQKMESRDAGPARPVDPEWVRLKIRLTKNTKDGPPAEGYRVTLIEQKPGGQILELLSDRADAAGIVDCGLMRSDKYFLNIETPWREGTSDQFYLRAGESQFVRAVVCPGEPAPTISTVPVIDWPAGLRDQERVGAIVQLSGGSQRTIDGTVWNGPAVEINCIARPDGSLLEVGPLQELIQNPGSVRGARNRTVVHRSLRSAMSPQPMAEIRRAWTGTARVAALIRLPKDSDEQILMAFDPTGSYSPWGPVPEGMTEERLRVELPGGLVTNFLEALKEDASEKPGD